MPEYRKEWFAKAKIDYFAPFVNLWLSCNAWYMDHYSEIANTDRNCIDKVKGDNTRRNHIFTRFNKLILTNYKEGIVFRSNIEQLIFALQQAQLVSDKIGNILFEQAVCDYSKKENKINLLANPRLKKDGTVFEDDKENVIKLDSIYVTSDIKNLFAGLFEIIYQVRNCLIHGHMNPGDNEYQVVKYAYLVLYDIMSF